jgi:hypothetical protein
MVHAAAGGSQLEPVAWLRGTSVTSQQSRPWTDARLKRASRAQSSETVLGGVLLVHPTLGARCDAGRCLLDAGRDLGIALGCGRRRSRLPVAVATGRLLRLELFAVWLLGLVEGGKPAIVDCQSAIFDDATERAP